MFNKRKSETLGEMIAIRLEQRGFTAKGSSSQVWIYQNKNRQSPKVLSITRGSQDQWEGFWYWHDSNGIYKQFALPSEYRYGPDDPLSVEIAFMEFMETNGYAAVDGEFFGKPADAGKLVRSMAK